MCVIVCVMSLVICWTILAKINPFNCFSFQTWYEVEVYIWNVPWQLKLIDYVIDLVIQFFRERFLVCNVHQSWDQTDYIYYFLLSKRITKFHLHTTYGNWDSNGWCAHPFPRLRTIYVERPPCISHLLR